jgi:hypothetical protein
MLYKRAKVNATMLVARRGLEDDREEEVGVEGGQEGPVLGVPSRQ